MLADDHTLVSEATEEFLRTTGRDYVILGKAGDAAETLLLVSRHQSDILFLDYDMPGMNRLSDFCAEVRRLSPKTHILMLTGHEHEEVAFEAAISGAKGYISKRSSFPDLVNAIDTVLAGGIWVDPLLPPQVHHTFLQHRGEGSAKLHKLSRQELKILSLVAEGRSNKEIGGLLHIDKRTVRNHLTHILAKLGVANRAQAGHIFLPGKKGPVRGRRKTGM